MQGELRVGEKEGQCIQWNGTLQGHPKSEAPIELAIKLVHLEPPRKGTTSELQIADTAGCPEQCFTAQKKTIGHTHKSTPISQDDSHTDLSWRPVELVEKTQPAAARGRSGVYLTS
jgi:hypothetical protein